MVALGALLIVVPGKISGVKPFEFALDEAISARNIKFNPINIATIEAAFNKDYENKYLSKETLLEVCTIINTYLWERTKKSSLVNENFDFSKMVHELNQVIYDEQS